MAGAALLIPFSLAFPGEINGYGLPRFLKRVNLENGVFKARTIVLKIVSSALSIGSGNSAGTEGPIAQIGGAIGSQVGQRFRVSGQHMKIYILGASRASMSAWAEASSASASAKRDSASLRASVSSAAPRS